MSAATAGPSANKILGVLKPRAHRAPEDRNAGNDEEVDVIGVLEHPEDIERMSSRRLDEASWEARECLNKLDNASCFGTSHRAVSAGGSAAGPVGTGGR